MKKGLVLSLMSLFLNLAQGAEDHSQHHNKVKEKKHSAQVLTLNNGVKWEADETMKKNMDAIYVQYKKLDSLMVSNKAESKDTQEMSRVISDSAQQIASHCKMQQKQDETFHVILAELLASSEKLRDLKFSRQALNELKKTLDLYSEYFNHSWK